MRSCPVCSVSLEEVQMHDETVDRCPDCNGIYFDKGELESIVGLVAMVNSVKLSEEDIDTIEPEEQERELPCPVDGVVMEKRDIGGYVIDLCPSCSGIWLDNDEITLLKLTEDHIKQNLQLYIRLGQ
ncbi:MAG: hypothetical protein EP343_05435 [Deltaproteobacteria bacterium]|nr:MAG: hypothetical protein EP343_05435 [Deltaproteobacteria bacterium]